jgi:hypothetical protein
MRNIYFYMRDSFSIVRVIIEDQGESDRVFNIKFILKLKSGLNWWIFFGFCYFF